MVQSPVQQITVAEMIANVIMQRTDRVFGLIGNGNVDLMSTLTSAHFPLTTVRHEVAVVTAADAYFRATGQMAVATATYGAGFRNRATGLAEAQLARIPMVAVVGEAPATARRPFDIDQQTVTAGLNLPMRTVAAYNVSAIRHPSFHMAADGQEPVVVLVPSDLDAAPVEHHNDDAGNYTPVALPQATDAELAGIADALVAAERPLILTGGGVVRSATGPLARELGDA